MSSRSAIARTQSRTYVEPTAPVEPADLVVIGAEEAIRAGTDVETIVDARLHADTEAQRAQALTVADLVEPCIDERLEAAELDVLAEPRTVGSEDRFVTTDAEARGRERLRARMKAVAEQQRRYRVRAVEVGCHVVIVDAGARTDVEGEPGIIGEQPRGRRARLGSRRRRETHEEQERMSHHARRGVQPTCRS